MRTRGCGAGFGARERSVRARATAGAILALAALVGVVPRPAVADSSAAWDTARARGWSYLIDRLSLDGVDPAEVGRVFADPRFPSFDGMQFKLVPSESHAMYRGFLAPASVTRARRCRTAWADDLEAAEARFGVQASLITAILHVETACGENTGRNPILPALARLAMAGEPDNLARNAERHAGEPISLESEAAQPTIDRARKLEEIFYPEVLGAFEISSRLRIDPLDIRGSGSGAFGIPQFLPTSYLRYGRDGDGDGRISLYDRADAIASCASYLQAHGWRPGLSRSEQRTIIWNYNRSTPYIDAVLGLRDRIESPEPVVAEPRPRTAHRAKAKATRTATKTRSKSATTSTSASAKPPASTRSKTAAR